MVIWITGLSGSGKTTIGKEVYAKWKSTASNTVMVDGDEVRRILKFDEGEKAYSIDGRRIVAERIAEMCAWLDSQEINVVCCTMSFFTHLHRLNRERLSAYFEVYLSVPMEVLYQRDYKDLYKPALRGEKKNVIGVDIPFIPPSAPDMVIDNSAEMQGEAELKDIGHRILQEALSRARK